jgi:hypothetical protein
MSSAREARRPLLAQGFNNLKARGVQDILVLCGDGLPGLPDAVRNVFPRRGCATVTTRCDTAGCGGAIFTGAAQYEKIHPAIAAMINAYGAASRRPDDSALRSSRP